MSTPPPPPDLRSALGLAGWGPEGSEIELLREIAPHLTGAALELTTYITLRGLLDEPRRLRLATALLPRLLDERSYAAAADTLVRLPALVGTLSLDEAGQALASLLTHRESGGFPTAAFLLACHAGDAERTAELNAELEAADNWTRRDALLAAAPYLPTPYRRAWIARLSRAVSAAPDSDDVVALGMLSADLLPEPGAADALELAARLMRDPAVHLWDRVRQLGRLATRVYDSDAARARALLEGIDPSDIPRWQPQAEPVPLLWSLASRDQLQRAVGLLASEWYPEASHLAAELAPNLDRELLEEALQAVRQRAEDGGSSGVLRALAPHLSGSLLDAAIEAAASLENPWLRAEAARALVERAGTAASPTLRRMADPPEADTLHRLLRELDDGEREEPLLELANAFAGRYGGASAAPPPDEVGPPAPQDEDAPPSPAPAGEFTRAFPTAEPAPAPAPPAASVGAARGAGDRVGRPSRRFGRSGAAKSRAGQSGAEESGAEESGADRRRTHGPVDQPVVNTGFADAATPETRLPPALPLHAGEGCWFWLEVGERLDNAIDVRPATLPVEHLPTDAELEVALFGFPGELQPFRGQDVGRIRVLPGGGARVVRQPAVGLELSDGSLAQRRLFFPVRVPAAEGTYRLRCCLYYRKTLVQSHLVVARAASTLGRHVSRVRGRVGRLLGAPTAAALRTEVDYNLSAALRPGHLAGLEPHVLSLMLNDNGNGTHGFRFFGAEDFKQDATFTAEELSAFIRGSREVMREAAWGTRTAWLDQPYRYDAGRDLERLRRDLAEFARVGYRFFDAVIDRLAAGDRPSAAHARDAVRDLGRIMARSGVVQLASKRSAREVLPIAMIYDHRLDSTLPNASYSLCDAFLDTLARGETLADSACFTAACPNRDQPDVVCPSGFWGYRHALGLPLGTDLEAASVLEYGDAVRLTVAVSTDPLFRLRAVHEGNLRGLHPQLDWHYAATRDDTLRLLQAAESPHVLYFYCHGGLADGTPYLLVGPPGERGITRDLLRGIFWERPRPLVFINGCHTAALEPDVAIDLVTGFVQTLNGAGVIGTEITIFEPLATTFAEECLRHFLADRPIGEAVRLARLRLLQDANPLGLAYIPFVLATLRLVHAAPPSAV